MDVGYFRRWLVISILIGLIAGAASILFYLATKGGYMADAGSRSFRRVKLSVQNHQIKLAKPHILACTIRYQRGNISTVVAPQASMVKSVKQVVGKGNNPTS